MLENYSGTPSTEGGLLVMIDSYNNLKMNDLAYDAYRVLKENYPEYTVAETENNLIKVYKKVESLDAYTDDKAVKDEGSWLSYFNIFNYF
jgi:outer membrane protein assembly factor BamD (BamD/ComL family)